VARSEDDLASQVLVYSRVPRTLALVLAGASMAVCGLLMQMLARNHFGAFHRGHGGVGQLGMLAAFLWVPHWPVMAKMGIPALGGCSWPCSRIRLRRDGLAAVLAGGWRQPPAFWRCSTT
jgi:ABC-type enterochelin transport system permease subunit